MKTSDHYPAVAYTWGECGALSAWRGTVSGSLRGKQRPLLMAIGLYHNRPVPYHTFLACDRYPVFPCTGRWKAGNVPIPGTAISECIELSSREVHKTAAIAEPRAFAHLPKINLTPFHQSFNSRSPWRPDLFAPRYPWILRNQLPNSHNYTIAGTRRVYTSHPLDLSLLPD